MEIFGKKFFQKIFGIVVTIVKRLRRITQQFLARRALSAIQKTILNTNYFTLYTTVYLQGRRTTT